jgi:predicted XRE-type DNA-binding protein
MDIALVVVMLIVIVFSLLIPAFIWVNNRFNNYEEFDELGEGAIVKFEIKKQLLQELLNWINDNNLNAKQIQEKLSVTSMKSADIIYQRVDKFTIDSLTNLVLRIGKTVTVSIHD